MNDTLIIYAIKDLVAFYQIILSHLRCQARAREGGTFLSCNCGTMRKYRSCKLTIEGVVRRYVLFLFFCECIYACSHLEIMGIFQGLDKYTQSITPLCAGIVWTIQREEKKNQP